MTWAILGTLEMVFGEGSASYQEPTGAAMADPTGETDRNALRLDFDRRLLLQFRGSVIISDAGLLAYRELEDTLCLTDAAANMLADAHTSKKGRHQRWNALNDLFGTLGDRLINTQLFCINFALLAQKT
jgi:hypothetical protein